MKLSIKTNFPDVSRMLAGVQRGIADQATARALNRTVEGARTDMSREIRSEYRVTSAYVRERLAIRRAYAKGQLQLSAELVGGKGAKRSANIIRFLESSTTLAQAKKRRKAGTLGQLFVQVKRTGGKKPLGPAFLGNRGRTVFVREGDKRLPIKPVQTIDVAQMFNSRRINAAVVRAIQNKLPINVERELRFYLARAGL